MSRRISKIVATVSLILAVTVIAIWLIGEWQGYGFHWQRPGRVHLLVLGQGEITYMRWSGTLTTSEGLSVEANAGRIGYGQGWLGFWMSSQQQSGYHYFAVKAPYWFVALLFGAPAIIIAVKNRRRVPASGLCHHCEYDLTGNVSGDCPECGTALVSDSQTA